MIESFKCKETKKIFENKFSKKFPSDIQERAMRKLKQLNFAREIEDLQLPSSNRLHSLHRELKGFWSISINTQYRIIFRFEEGNAYDVRLTDYH